MKKHFSLPWRNLPGALPSGTEIFAIGDVHGQADLLEAALASIAQTPRTAPLRELIFLSRCPPIMLRPLSTDELIAFARRQGECKGLSDMSVDVIEEALRRCSSSAEISLRTVVRMIEKAIAFQNRALHLH